MSDINWPSTLPRPRPSGTSETPGHPVVRTKMDAGPPKVRRRHTAGVRKWKMAFDLTLAQVDELDVFYETTTAHGTLRFNMTNPRTEATEEFRFKGPPTHANVGGELWESTVEMEQLPQ